MSDKTYDVSKVLFSCLPFVSSFILLLKDTWGIPYAEQIAITLGGVSTLGLAILNEISKAFFKEHTIIENLDDGIGEE